MDFSEICTDVLVKNVVFLYDPILREVILLVS